MSFDEIALPHRLAFGAVGGPQFSTDVIQVDGGFERRNQNWVGARRQYKLLNTLRSAADTAEILNFFHARAGRARGFRFRDWADYTTASDHISVPSATNVLLGTGNGTQTQFQLKKIYSSGSVSHERTIKKPVAGTVVVALNDVPQGSGWSVDTTTGLVTFSVAPGSGVTVKAGCQFDVPVRFETDALNIASPDYQLQQADVTLLEIRL